MSLSNDLARTPPMGWNSFDCYGSTVREDEVRANADYMAAHLKAFGWEYLVIDIEWYAPGGKADRERLEDTLRLDAHGRLVPTENRFPCAKDGAGMKPLADYVHGLGLKFGIHIMRGVPRKAVEENMPILGTKYRAGDIADQGSVCAWCPNMYGVDMSKPGAQAYYDSIVALYAEWEVDYIKADDFCSPYYAAEIEALSNAIGKCGRDMVLSLSPGDRATPGDVEHMKQHCEMWRISSDFWDQWWQLKRQFDLCRRWAPHVGPGHWPDADMLPLGRISIRGHAREERQSRFTPDEQRTLMTLWAIFRSPLMYGGDLPGMDEDTLPLLTNPEVLAVNQNSTAGRELHRRDDHIAWAADASDSDDKYLALFNDREEPAKVCFAFSDLGMPGECQVRDLWKRADLGEFKDSFSVDLPVHGCGLYCVTPGT